MFSSNKWRGGKFSATKEGKDILQIVVDSGEFWQNVAKRLKVALPLIRVLRLVDLDEKPAMPFTYDEMSRAKEKLKQNFGNVKKRYITDSCLMLYMV
jgi:hypothetical protein